MKAHSGRLSVVAWSRAKLADRPLNEATEAVSGIVRRPAFVGPHISSIFISSLLTKAPLFLTRFVHEFY